MAAERGRRIESYRGGGGGITARKKKRKGVLLREERQPRKERESKGIKMLLKLSFKHTRNTNSIETEMEVNSIFYSRFSHTWICTPYEGNWYGFFFFFFSDDETEIEVLRGTRLSTTVRRLEVEGREWR